MIITKRIKINVGLTQQIKFPISIISLNGEIDVTLPEYIYADLLVSTGHGNLYTDMPMEQKKTDKGKEVTLTPLSPLHQISSHSHGNGDNNGSQ